MGKIEVQIDKGITNNAEAVETLKQEASAALAMAIPNYAVRQEVVEFVSQVYLRGLRDGATVALKLARQEIE